VAEDFQRILPDAKLVFLSQYGHAPMMEKPKVFNKILENFIIDIAVLQLLYKCRGDSTLIDRAFNTIS